MYDSQNGPLGQDSQMTNITPPNLQPQPIDPVSPQKSKKPAYLASILLGLLIVGAGLFVLKQIAVRRTPSNPTVTSETPDNTERHYADIEIVPNNDDPALIINNLHNAKNALNSNCSGILKISYLSSSDLLTDEEAETFRNLISSCSEAATAFDNAALKALGNTSLQSNPALNEFKESYLLLSPRLAETIEANIKLRDAFDQLLLYFDENGTASTRERTTEIINEAFPEASEYEAEVRGALISLTLCDFDHIVKARELYQKVLDCNYCDESYLEWNNYTALAEEELPEEYNGYDIALLDLVVIPVDAEIDAAIDYYAEVFVTPYVRKCIFSGDDNSEACKTLDALEEGDLDTSFLESKLDYLKSADKLIDSTN